MVQLIVGNKGKGKTKHLLDKVNAEIKDVSGNVVYLDRSTKHMFELNNRIRLINVSEFLINSPETFIGFVEGIISQDHDLEKMYLDGFLEIACIKKEELEATLNKLEHVSNKFQVEFVLSASVDAHDLPEAVKEKVIIAL